MRILVDADACPVKEIIVKLAKENNIDVKMYLDNSHIYSDGYSKVLIFDKGADSVDYALIKDVLKGDIVVTQDYGVAAMALAKAGIPIHQNGTVFTNFNIDSFLNQRYTGQKMRRAGLRTKGPKKRTKDHDKAFFESLNNLIKNQ